MATTRLDVYLVEKGWASSRTHAQELIESQQVFLILKDLKKTLTKASFGVSHEMQIQVVDGPANRFVSRGGLKLEGALKEACLDVSGLIALDVGLSTGGFTDCLLKAGAKAVVGIDVGHNQVHSSLKEDPRLQSLEGLNARELSQNSDFAVQSNHRQFDLIVMDVSFISISLIIPGLIGLLAPGGHLLSLVKPQFEVGIDGLAKGGIVKDASLFAKVEARIKSVCEESGLTVLQYFSSSISGKDGNSEFFVYAHKN